MIKKKKIEIKFEVEKTAELLPYLIEIMPHKSRDNVKSLLRNKLVLVDGQTQSHAKFAVHRGQKITIGKKEEKLAEIPGVNIIFEDDAIIVVEKPAGLLTIGTNKDRDNNLYRYLSTYVKLKNPLTKVFVVHRLDRETSGVLVFAKSEPAKFRLQKNWNDQVRERSYMAVVEGKVQLDQDRIVSYMRESKALIVHSSPNATYGKEAITNYKVLERYRNSTLLELHLETGRKNQIRVHMKEIGHSVIGDKKYGSTVPMPGRIALHAKTLSFEHPMTKKVVSFDSKVPKEFFKR